MGRSVARLSQPASRHPVRKPGHLARRLPPLAPGPADAVPRPWADVLFRVFHGHRDHRRLGAVDLAGLDRWRQRSDSGRRGVQLFRLDGRPGTADLPVLFLDRDVGAVRQLVPVSGAAQPARFPDAGAGVCGAVHLHRHAHGAAAFLPRHAADAGQHLVVHQHPGRLRRGLPELRQRQPGRAGGPVVCLCVDAGRTAVRRRTGSQAPDPFQLARHCQPDRARNPGRTPPHGCANA